MNDKNISIIIPVFNMASDLKDLIRELIEKNHLNFICEIIIVDDGSNSPIIDTLGDLLNAFPIKVHRLEKNHGRFIARFEGAKLAAGKNLLFMDARTRPINNLSDTLSLFSHYRVIQGVAELDINQSIYNLYWDRTHRILFKKNIEDQNKGFWLNSENFHQYVSGTTIFYVEKKIFLDVCSSFDVPPKNDDRSVILKITEITPIWVTDKLNVLWWPRQELVAFLARLWERGPSFVEYHIYGPGSYLKGFVYFGLIMTLINILMIIFVREAAFYLVLGELLLIFFSAFLFIKSIKEIPKIGGLHLLVVIVFGAGILKEVFKQLITNKK